MGNSQSIDNENLNNRSDINNIQDTRPKSILKKNIPNLKINNNKTEIKEDYFDEPQNYHKSTKLELDERINQYQYFHTDPVVNYDFSNQIGQESKKDIRYQDNVTTKFNEELDNRDLNNKNDLQNATQIYEDKVRKQIAGSNRNSLNSNIDVNSQIGTNNQQTYIQQPTVQQPYIQQASVQQPYIQQASVQQFYTGNQFLQQQDYLNEQQSNNNQYNQNGQITMSREKALEIKNIKKFTNLDKRLMIMNNIEIGYIDPINIINNTPRITLDELKTKYLSLRNIHHPDKGGNKEMFILILDALKNINFIINSRLIDKDFNELKRDYNAYNSNEKKKNPVGDEALKLMESIGKNFSNQKFNKYFDENKFSDDINYEGYADIMVDGGVREDIEIDRFINKFEKNSFNNEFNKNKRQETGQVVKYIEPVALNEDIYYKQLGRDNENFSGKSNSIEYIDYKDAFTIHNTLDVPEYKPKNTSLEEIEKERETDNLEMTDEQKLVIENNANNSEITEKKRRANLNQFDHDLGIHFEKTHKSMISW